MIGYHSWCTTGVFNVTAFVLIYFYVICFFFVITFVMARYADDNTPHCIGKTQEEVISKLETYSKSIFEWF